MFLVIGSNEKFPNLIHNIFKCLKLFFRLILLILIVVFITFSPRTRFIVGGSLKQISSFLLWTVKYEDREKWIMDNPVGFQLKSLLPLNK